MVYNHRNIKKIPFSYLLKDNGDIQMENLGSKMRM